MVRSPADLACRGQTRHPRHGDVHDHQVDVPGPSESHRLHSVARLRDHRQAGANLFFQLVSSRYERASLIVTSNKPFGRWGEVFGDDVVAAAMIDRLVHHAEVIALKGDSYRLKDRDIGRATPSNTDA